MDLVLLARAVGIGLLYVSGFVFYNVHVEASYFIPSLWTDLILPTIACAVFITSVYGIIYTFLLKYESRFFAPPIARICLTFIIIVGFRGLIAVSGMGDVNTIVVNLFGNSRVLPLSELRVYKIIILVVAITIIYAGLCFASWPNGMERVVKVTSVLGYSLFFLALYNITQSTRSDHKSLLFRAIDRSMSSTSKIVSEKHSRRVVWVILDELDYRLVLGAPMQNLIYRLDNFQQLASKAVNAREALSPSNATLTSIPSLLIGAQTAGEKRLGSANYQMIGLDGKPIIFSEENTLFGRVRAHGEEFSIMGFYHPYCIIFTNASQCFSDKFGTNKWYSALVDWVPSLSFFGLDPMFAISEGQLSRIPNMLQRTEDAVTYLHLNIPHLPNYYASKYYGKAYSTDYLNSYLLNLRLADEVLGQIVKQLEDVSANQEVLLIVSGDHGFRAIMKSPDEARPVPWIAWRVGASDGEEIATTISTVHTAALIEDFLAGKVTSQTEIARWWHNKPIFPRLTTKVSNVE